MRERSSGEYTNSQLLFLFPIFLYLLFSLQLILLTRIWAPLLFPRWTDRRMAGNGGSFMFLHSGGTLALHNRNCGLQQYGGERLGARRRESSLFLRPGHEERIQAAGSLLSRLAGGVFLVQRPMADPVGAGRFCRAREWIAPGCLLASFGSHFRNLRPRNRRKILLVQNPAVMHLVPRNNVRQRSR